MKKENEIKKILNDLLRVEARSEAFLILKKASDEQLEEFMTYYKKNKENICCMVLDFIKMKLVESGDMTMKENDYFGKPFI